LVPAHELEGNVWPFSIDGEVSMRAVLAAMLIFGAVLGGRPALSAEIKVLTTGAFRPIVSALAPEFERLSGDTVVEAHDTAGAIVRRIEGGESFDVVVLTSAGVIDLAARGKVVNGEIARLARVGIGVVVKEGAPVPSIDSVGAFKQTLLDAPTIAYIDPAAGGSSGIYLSQLFQRLHIADEVKAKAVLVHGGLVADRVVQGDAAIGMQQISEILSVKGVRLVGPLPDEIQNYTIYAGGIGVNAARPEAALRLLTFLQSPTALALLKENGMEPPRD
jgi:molybdate transport system substrate-binding protein